MYRANLHIVESLLGSGTTPTKSRRDHKKQRHRKKKRASNSPGVSDLNQGELAHFGLLNTTRTRSPLGRRRLAWRTSAVSSRAQPHQSVFWPFSKTLMKRRTTGSLSGNERTEKKAPGETSFCHPLCRLPPDGPLVDCYLDLLGLDQTPLRNSGSVLRNLISRLRTRPNRSEGPYAFDIKNSIAFRSWSNVTFPLTPCSRRISIISRGVASAITAASRKVTFPPRYS